MNAIDNISEVKTITWPAATAPVSSLSPIGARRTIHSGLMTFTAMVINGPLFAMTVTPWYHTANS
jgi:hypothetical protein